jgi:hypothetical protein
MFARCQDPRRADECEAPAASGASRAYAAVIGQLGLCGATRQWRCSGRGSLELWCSSAISAKDAKDNFERGALLDPLFRLIASGDARLDLTAHAKQHLPHRVERLRQLREQFCVTSAGCGGDAGVGGAAECGVVVGADASRERQA